MNDRKSSDAPGDPGIFAGYLLRGLEQALTRIELRQLKAEARFTAMERKLDTLGSGLPPADITQTIAAINAETAKVNAATATLADVTESLDKTGVSDAHK